MNTSNRFPMPESDQGFSCPAGCLAPEACFNVPLILNLTETQKQLDSVMTDPDTLETIKAIEGNLGSIAARASFIQRTDAALEATCGLWQNSRFEVGVTVVTDKDLPTID